MVIVKTWEFKIWLEKHIDFHKACDLYRKPIGKFLHGLVEWVTSDVVLKQSVGTHQKN